MISYKDTLELDNPFSKFNIKRRSSVAPDSIPIIATQPLPISKEKKADLISLLTLVPDVFHRFYLDLPTTDNVRDTDPDIFDDEEDN